MRAFIFIVILFTSAPAFAAGGECFEEAIGDGFLAIAYVMIRVVTVVTPHGGVGIEQEEGDAVLNTIATWPLTFSFEPVIAESKQPRKCGEPWVDQYLGSRVILEPQVVVAWKKPVVARFALRAGYRFMFHRAGAKFGFGAGIGTRYKPARTQVPSLSPELVFQVGECCAPSYLNVALRYDRYFDIEANAATVTFGWAFD